MENTRCFPILLVLTHTQLPSISTPPPTQSGTLVTINESALAHYNHSESIVYIRITLGCVHPMDLDKCMMMTCIHHDSITQISFTTQRILCSAYIHPSLPTTIGNHRSFSLSIVLPFPEVIVKNSMFIVNIVYL